MDLLLPSGGALHGDIYIATELMQCDLHRIIVSSQPITIDHIKVFVYQILRGLKYIHSARILHRDIKPGNILINANCCLKICDFGLARVEERDESAAMTHEVVTQYYRAPEILMGARHYTAAVDVWSVGCILAELLSRRILFQAKSPVQQLELILAVLGTPAVQDMRHVCAAARLYVQRRPACTPNTTVLYALSKDSGHEVVHLLCQLLVFNPARRLSASNALTHPYLDEGRLRYHTYMCSCQADQHSPSSSSSEGGGGDSPPGARRGGMGPCPMEEELDPICPVPFRLDFEDQLSNVFRCREKIYQLCQEMELNNERSLFINTSSPLYGKLANSQCAQASQGAAASTAHHWD
jgi:nemo like kinase